jgi:hypothetical protein
MNAIVNERPLASHHYPAATQDERGGQPSGIRVIPE